MFIRIVKSKGNSYAQLAEAYREDGVVKHRVLFSLGRVDKIAGDPMYQRLAKRLCELSQAQTLFAGNQDIEEVELKNWGWVVYDKLWSKFNLPRFFTDLKNKHPRMQLDPGQSTFLMVIQHLLDPKSKLATFNNQECYQSMPEVDLNHLYRCLDLLADSKDQIEQHVYQQNRSLFNMSVDVVFYDVTTFYFESFESDELRNFGFSKDNKVNQVQVVMGLLIDCEGRPVGYELFSGNTFDSKTLVTALDSLKKRFDIDKIIIVADRGINSKSNLKAIANCGFGYIVASRLKSGNKKLLEEVFSPEGYVYASASCQEDKVFRYKSIPYTNYIREKGKPTESLNEKIIVSYSSKRAAKDKADRERLVEKAEKLKQNPSQLNSTLKRGGRKYIKTVELEESQVMIDTQAIERDACFDGYYAIQTSELNMTEEEVISAYHNLWKIEESFRVMKSTLEVRPIFHWTERRIKGHFVVCFLAFLLERTLEYLMKTEDEASPNNIRDAINSMRFTAMKVDGKDYFIRHSHTSLASKIAHRLHIKIPPTLVSKETNLSDAQGL